MAIVNRDSVPARNTVPPRMLGNYTLRVLESEYGPSKGKQNPQMQWSCEIVSPKEITLDGKKYILDGMPVTYYFPIILLENGEVNMEKTQAAQDRFLQVLKVLGFPEEFDPENMNPKQYEGLVFDAILDSSEDIPQKPNGKGGYEPILGADGKPVSRGWKINVNNFAPACNILNRSSV